MNAAATMARALRQGRAAAQVARMTDSCLIERQTGTAYDDAVKGEVPTWETVYTGRCEFVGRVEQATVRESAGRDVSTLAGLLRLPHDTTDVAEGQLVTCTGSRHRPALVGHQALVTGEDHASNRTAIRVGLTAVTS